MDEPNREIIARYWPAFDSRDGEAMRALARDDLVTEWPQSGERIVGKENCVTILRNYPGGGPRRSERRTLGSGDVWVTESRLEYPNGQSSHFVSIFELKDGKLARLTENFADPFEAPAWRMEFVDAM
ncbi:MAG TPA: nuclear transport factor 2 family protein [Candidatus Limnocylindria bacterium]